MIRVFREEQLIKQREEIGKYHLVIVDGLSRRSKDQVKGLTDTGKRVIFDKVNGEVIGDIGKEIVVKINDCTENTLFAESVGYSTVSNWGK